MSEPEPGFAVVAGSARDYGSQYPTTALLIIEVSDSTLAYDRVKDGKMLTTQDTDKLEEGDHHDPKKVLAFLRRWVLKN